jgi:carbon-monoxide dehydrogenase medium subunit
MYLPQFEYLVPANSAELSSMLLEHGDDARILSGGTDLMVQMKEQVLQPGYVIDISRLEDLAGIQFDAHEGLTIGAAQKLDVILEDPIVREKYSALWSAIKTIGARQIRSMGSLGGNLCNASPAADTPPALVALDAQVTIAGGAGTRQLAFENFILGNRKTALEPGEYLQNITLPAPPKNSGSAYHHFRVRGGMEIAMVSAAVRLTANPAKTAVDDARIVLGVVGPTPIRALDAEQKIIGQTASDEVFANIAALSAEVSQPIDDFRASAEYRTEILKYLLENAFSEAWAHATGTQTGGK